VRAEVAVEMDFDRVETREERFDPDNQVARSTQSANETSRSAENGPVSVQNNLPGAEPAGGQSGSQESRQEETSNFEIGRTIRNVLREHPTTRRLSVAVLVDGITEPQPNGPPQFRERTAEELSRIAALVRSAVGFDERRGDRVEIVSMRFAIPEIEAPQSGRFGLDITEATLARLLETGVLALVGLLALFLVGRPIAKRLAISLSPQAALPSGAGAALPAATGGRAIAAAAGASAMVGAPALPPGAESEDMVSLAHIQGQLRASSIARITSLVEENPEAALSVVRRWLAPDDRP
jgi:flagellar M-ring protein FliF